MFLQTIRDEPLPRAAAAVSSTMLVLAIASPIVWHFWPDHTTAIVCGGYEGGLDAIKDDLFGHAEVDLFRVPCEAGDLIAACVCAFVAAVQEERRKLYLSGTVFFAVLFLLLRNVGLPHGGCLMRS